MISANDFTHQNIHIQLKREIFNRAHPATLPFKILEKDNQIPAESIGEFYFE
jgi:hypothetical protein